MIDLFEDVDLGNGELYLFHNHQLLLLEHFEGVWLLCVDMCCQEHLTERSLTELLYEFETTQFKSFLVFLLDL